MLTVHHLDNSRSHRVLWLLEELGVDYEIVEYKRGADMRAPAALRSVHPLGKAPVVKTDDGRVLAESGAIIGELVETLGPHLRPEPGTEAFRRYRYFLHYAEGSLMPPLLVKLITDQLRTGPVPFFLKPIGRAIAGKIDGAYTNAEIRTHLTFLDGELSSRSFVAGEFTGADVQLSFPLAAAESRAPDFGRYPNLASYLKRLRDRPAYQRALEKGGRLRL